MENGTAGAVFYALFRTPKVCTISPLVAIPSARSGQAPLSLPVMILSFMAIVAQLVRASGCGPEGRGFESHRSPQKYFLSDSMSPGALPADDHLDDEHMTDEVAKKADAELHEEFAAQDPARGLNTDPTPPGP